MISAILIIGLAFYWLMIETNWLRVRLPMGVIPKPTQLERIDWDTCVLRYPPLKLSPGIPSPICGWEWLKNNTHPIPQVKVDFTSGGVRYHWEVKDCNILKDAITATHTKIRNGNGHRHFKRNKLGGLIAPLPAKVK